MAPQLFVAWILALWAQVCSLPLVSAASRVCIHTICMHLACIFIPILLLTVSRHMFRWRRHRPRHKRQRSLSFFTRLTSSCAQASMFVLRTVVMSWLLLMCAVICTSCCICTWTAHPDHALHSEIDVIALRTMFASPAARQLPDLGLQSRLAAFTQHMLHAHPPAQSALHPCTFHIIMA
jgi:hypothetical protein